MRTRIIGVLCGLVAAGGPSLLAQQGFVPAPTGVRLAEPWRPSATKGLGRIVGTVVDEHRSRVPNARMQLRNLITGEVEQETTANERGEYEFTIANPSTFVVEMILVGGGVVALSNAGSVSRDDTLQTVVQISGRWDGATSRVVPLQHVTDYFGMSSRATMTAATLELAVDLNIPASDPGEPVSP